jgi:galactose mutarotase-like enzyme
MKMDKNVFEISNGVLKIEINKKGAELNSVRQLNNQYEFMWNANPAIWNRHAPVLFPIVGKLNNNKVLINSNFYEMGQHGFARDCDFDLANKTETELQFLLKSNEQTLTKFPFQFELYIIYAFTHESNQLKVTYKIVNKSALEMPFSIGAHPGFMLPVANLNEFEIDFFEGNSIERHLLADGLFNNKTETLPLINHKLSLSEEVFDKDAIVIKNCASKTISLNHKNSNFKVSCSFNDFTDLGIWAKKGNHHFVCLEPWLGYADDIGFEGDISSKKGIIILPKGDTFEASYYLNFTS